MKYVGRILMAIILLLLTACGTPAAEVSTKPGQHTGTVQMEDGTDSSAVSGQLDYIPPMDFHAVQRLDGCALRRRGTSSALHGRGRKRGYTVQNIYNVQTLYVHRTIRTMF